MSHTPDNTPLPSAHNRQARLCVSALSGGGGKTLLSLGLARAAANLGVSVKPFKKGPDYIDAAWLALAAGRPATNLDPYFLPPERLRALFVHAMETAAPVAEGARGGVLGLVEGNRGLFDGLDVAGSCATAALARVLACPVLLSVDCTKMTRTAAALVRGVLTFEPGLTFAGVVLNQVGSTRHERLLRQALEEYTDARVLGALPRLAENPLPERHMGIASHGDGLSSEAGAVLERLGNFVREHVDVRAVLDVAAAAPVLEAPPFWGAEAEPRGARVVPVRRASASVEGPAAAEAAPVRIGYVRDAALWFYYEENLEALRRAGAELTRLSLLDGGAGAEPWPELDGLYLGGGFPEDRAEALSLSPHLRRVAAWADAGMPVYAECGGFMLLCSGIERDGRLWPMSDVFPVTARFCPKPQGLGYVRGRVTAENPFFPTGMDLRGHEFHYSHCRWEGPAPAWAMELERGRGMGRPPEGGRAVDGLTRGRVWASYTHLFAPAVPCWARNFTAAARLYRAGRTGGGTT